MTQPAFTVDVDHNQYLPEGGRDVSAIATVISDGTPAAMDAGPGVGSAEIIIVDCSGSMDVPHTKIGQATPPSTRTRRPGRSPRRGLGRPWGPSPRQPC